MTAIKDNIPREKMAEGVWTDLKLQLLYDEQYEGEGLGITATKEISGDEVTVNAVLHNNGQEAASAGSVIVVALYSEDVFVDMAFVPVAANVNANSITSIIPVNLTSAKNITEIKVKLWDKNAFVPAASFVTTQ